MSDQAKPDRSPWPPLGVHLFSASTLAGRAAPNPSDELPNEDEPDHAGNPAVSAAPAPVAATATAADPAAELLNEEEQPATRESPLPRDTPDSDWPIEPAAAHHAAVPLPIERLVQPSRRTQIAWWVAGLCAALAIAEAGIIMGLIPSPWGHRSGVADLRRADATVSGARPGDPPTVLPGTDRPAVSPGGSGSHSEGQGARGSDAEAPSSVANSRRGAPADVGEPGLPSLLPAPPIVNHGWISIQSPLELQVREGGVLIGLTTADRLRLPSGRHVLALSNPEAAFDTTLTVQIEPAKTAVATVVVPNGSLSLNALPWATVTLDGQTLSGTTPFADLEVRVGPHAVVWAHPALGQRTQTVVVTATAPTRVVVDMHVK